jgi:hypothetical protein
MSRWKFQFVPNEKGVIGVGYRMDTVGELVEREVNAALRYPFKFHGVNKLVVELGPTTPERPDYIELAGVGLKQYPTFSAADYLERTAEDRRSMLVEITKDVFDWLTSTFDDAEFARIGLRNLGWAFRSSTTHSE